MHDRRHHLGLLAGGAVALAAGGTRVFAADRLPGAAGEVLLVMEKRSHALSFYDLTSGERLASVDLPAYPHEFAVDSRNAFAYVGHYGVEESSDGGPGGTAVFVIDLARRAQVRTIDCRPFNRIHGIRLDGRDRLFALSEEKATLLEFDTPATADAPDRASPTGGIKSHLFSVTRDGERAYVANILSNTVTLVRPFDPATPPVAVATGLWPEGNALSNDETTLYVLNRRSHTLCAIDAVTMAVRRTVPTRGDAVRIAVMPDGGLVLANLDDASLSILTPDLAERMTVKLTGKPVGLSIHPTRPVILASLDTNGVALVNPQERSVASIATQKEPDVTWVVPAR